MKKGIFLVAILLLPSVVYLLFSLGQHNTAKLQSYGAVSEILPNGDTVYQPIDLPRLSYADHSEIASSLVHDKAILIHLLDWPCEEGCIDGIATLNNYLNKVGLDDEWTLLSIVDSGPSQEELEQLSSQNIYAGHNWHFVQTMEFEHLRNQLFVETGRAATTSDIIGSEVVLLDQKLVVRGFFNLKFQQDNKQLQDAIKVIIQEPHISWKTDRKK